MKKYIIQWSAGYSEGWTEVEAKDESEAKKLAYKLWLDSAKEVADYSVVGESTKELRDEYL